MISITLTSRYTSNMQTTTTISTLVALITVIVTFLMGEPYASPSGLLSASALGSFCTKVRTEWGGGGQWDDSGTRRRGRYVLWLWLSRVYTIITETNHAFRYSSSLLFSFLQEIPLSVIWGRRYTRTIYQRPAATPKGQHVLIYMLFSLEPIHDYF